MNKPAIFLSPFLVLLLVGCSSTATLVKLDSRPGVTQGFIHIMPKEPPVASVILYAGGDGNLRLNSAYSMQWGEANFLVRTRQKFANHGFQVAVIDTPVNRQGHMTMSRRGQDHVTDSKAVANFLRSQAAVPVWIVGTSRGTESVSNLAVNGNGAFDGAVFTSSVRAASYFNLEEVTIPVLVVHNKLDGCGVSGPSVAENIYSKLVNSKNRELIWFSSTAKKSSDCQARSPHGYLGIESQVVDAIAVFIKSN